MTIIGPEAEAEAKKRILELGKALKDLNYDISHKAAAGIDQSVMAVTDSLAGMELKFTSLTDRLNFALSQVDNPIDFNKLIQLPKSKLDQIDALAIKLRYLQLKMLAIKWVSDLHSVA